MKIEQVGGNELRKVFRRVLHGHLLSLVLQVSLVSQE